MFDISHAELKDIDNSLNEKLQWAHEGSVLAEQLALDAARLLSCTDARLQDYVGQGFFKRCWFTLSGKTSALERATQADLVEMQKYAWRYINLLQERDLMLAHSMIATKNNLMTLAVGQGDLKGEVTRLADRVYDRFVALEERVGDLEASHRIHAWLLTIDTCDYDRKYPENLRFLRVVNDFYSLKSAAWNVVELRYLQKALKEVGIDPKKRVGVAEFIGAVIDEINAHGYTGFSALVPSCSMAGCGNAFVIDAVSSPAFSALYQIKENYTSSSRVIRSLQRRLDISHADAIRFVLTDFIDEMGIDTRAELPLKDLATEIVACLSLSHRLAADIPTARADGGQTVPPNLGEQEVAVAACADGQSAPPEEDRGDAVKKYLLSLDTAALKDFHKLGAIPEKKLGNAMISMAIPADETVWALIDATLFGSSTEGVALCARGVHWKNLGTAAGYVSWDDIGTFRNSIFVKSETELQLWTKGAISLVGSRVKAAFLKDVLVGLSTL